MAHSSPTNSIPLKVMIDKKNQRVAFAEADATFTDTLVSFLTIPLGTVINILLSRPEFPSFGSTKNLYQSVISLQPDMFFSSDCKTMLLHPKNSATYDYKRLKFKVDSSDWEGRETRYFCTNGCSFSLYEGMKCHCGRETTNKQSSFGAQAKSGAFVNERIMLLIGDDMRLLPLSTTSFATLLQEKGLTDQCNVLERKEVYVEVLQLLANVLFSVTPLTDVVFPKKLHPIYAPTDAKFLKNLKEELGTTAEEKERKFQVKLIVRKSDKKLFYAEAGSDFIDLVFSFLTIPTGAIVKLLGGNSPMNSLNTLFSSIKDSSTGNLLQVSKELLVNPKLAPCFKCDNQLLDLIHEVHPESYSAKYLRYVKMLNPKSPGSGADGGNFMKAAELFMVTDDLIVRPLALSDIVSVLDGYKVPIGNVEEILVTVGKCEALNLLKASLGSTTVLTDAFRTFLGASNSLNGQSFCKGGKPFC